MRSYLGYSHPSTAAVLIPALGTLCILLWAVLVSPSLPPSFSLSLSLSLLWCTGLCICLAVRSLEALHQFRPEAEAGEAARNLGEIVLQARCKVGLHTLSFRICVRPALYSWNKSAPQPGFMVVAASHIRTSSRPL